MNGNYWVEYTGCKTKSECYLQFNPCLITINNKNWPSVWHLSVRVWLFITRRKQQKSFCYDHCDVNLCTPLQGNSLWKSEKHSPLHCIFGFAYRLLSQWSHQSSHQYCMVSGLNVSLQITENCLYANTKTEKSKWKQQVRQWKSLSKLCRDIDNMSCA